MISGGLSQKYPRATCGLLFCTCASQSAARIAHIIRLVLKGRIAMLLSTGICIVNEESQHRSLYSLVRLSRSRYSLCKGEITHRRDRSTGGARHHICGPCTCSSSGLSLPAVHQRNDNVQQGPKGGWGLGGPIGIGTAADLICSYQSMGRRAQ